VSAPRCKDLPARYKDLEQAAASALGDFVRVGAAAAGRPPKITMHDPCGAARVRAERAERGAEVSALLKSVGAIPLFVADLQRSKSFYQDVFDVPVVYEDGNSAVFGFEHTIINLLSIAAADDLIKPGAVASREAGSRFQLTIWVDDADAVCAELHASGVVLLNGPMNREWGMRTASFTDPDGHIWEIAQELPQAEGS
jgi:catechol 2,3-dioxygenase-like lactoylglutathione lyase family enzyme